MDSLHTLHIEQHQYYYPIGINLVWISVFFDIPPVRNGLQLQRC